VTLFHYSIFSMFETSTPLRSVQFHYCSAFLPRSAHVPHDLTMNTAFFPKQCDPTGLWNGDVMLSAVDVYIKVYAKYGKGKGKVHPRRGREGPEGEWRCSFTLSLTSICAEWLHPVLFATGKETWYPSYLRLGGHRGRFRRVRKISFPPGFCPGPSSP